MESLMNESENAKSANRVNTDAGEAWVALVCDDIDRHILAKSGTQLHISCIVFRYSDGKYWY